MADIRIYDKVFTTYISADRIQQRVAELAVQINEDYAGKCPMLIGILNGSFIFAADLFRQLTIEAEISFIKLASYDGTESTGNVVTNIGLDSIKGTLNKRHIIIVEDIIDTGKTMSFFLPQLLQRLPASVTIATFLTKPSALKYPVKADYTAFEIEDKFVIGYGLDYDGLGRNLPDLYILKQ